MRNRFGGKFGGRMVASLTLFSFLSLTSLPALAAAPGDVSEGVLESSSGKVFVLSDGNSLDGQANSIISVGDVLRTGQDGQAILRVGKSRVRIAGNSELRIASMEGSPVLSLEHGRLLGSAGQGLIISTAKARTSASSGEFVLEANTSGASLRVLSGNAKMQALGSDEVKAVALEETPASPANSLLSRIGDLGRIQAVGEIAGEWATKGKGVRTRTTNESVGGDKNKNTPQRDISGDRRPAPPVVENPPASPPASTPAAPPATPPAVPPATAPAAVASSGFSPFWVLGGGLLIGGIILLASGNDHDNSGYTPLPPVPSPSLS